MLCEIGTSHGFLALWLVMTLSGLLTMILLSGSVFYYYYYRPTFETWQMKNNPKYPSAVLVKKEIIFMCKGLFIAAVCPAFSLMASKWQISKGYCSSDTDSIQSLTVQAFIIFFFTDFFEYAYHYLGHRSSLMWKIHRHHHMFYNPSPFAVIADEWADQFVRTWPMIILPMIMPINMDLLFGVYVIFFYGYGVYLHWGFEGKWLTAHNPIFNTAYHHYMHHAISSMNRPIYTGFFFKVWDQICCTEYDKCICALCRPMRSEKEWNEVEKPDYSVLLSPQWWMTSSISQAETSKDE